MLWWNDGMLWWNPNPISDAVVERRDAVVEPGGMLWWNTI
jgi:hypothetical protein